MPGGWPDPPLSKTGTVKAAKQPAAIAQSMASGAARPESRSAICGQRRVINGDRGVAAGSVITIV